MEQQPVSSNHLISLLEQDGDENRFLEKALPEDPDYTSDYDLPGQDYCQLCEIHVPPVEEDEEIFYENSNFYVVDTVAGPGDEEKGWDNGRKGHDVRNMAVWKEHGVLPRSAYAGQTEMVEKLRDITASQIGNGRQIIYGSMSSMPDHFHFVSSDLETHPSAEPDLGSINNYHLYQVENGEAIELLDVKARDKLGRYLEEVLSTPI